MQETKGKSVRAAAGLLAVMAGLLAGSGVAQAAGGNGVATGPGYNPSLTYPGPFVPNMVYYRNSPRSNWQRAINKLYSAGVTCPDALRHFAGNGLWLGHLYPDGSCGPHGEPVELSLGNRINFDLGSATHP